MSERPNENLSVRRIVQVIKPTHGFIKEEDRRVLQYHTSDGQPLFLSARNHQPPLSNLRLISVRKPLNRVVNIGSNSRSLDLLIRRIQSPVPDVVHNVGMEQGRVLRHDADCLSKRIKLDFRDVLPVDEDPSGGWFVEPVEETQNG